MTIRWLVANMHLLPSGALFLAGLFIIVKAPVSYAAKTKDYPSIFNPGKIMLENPSERKQLILGIILFIAGVLSLLLILKYHGYYFIYKDRAIFTH